MSVIEVSSELSYRVYSRASFTFSIMAAKTDYQLIKEETLTISPDIEHKIYCEQSVPNRLLRLQAQPGSLSLTYRAVVELRPHLDPLSSLEETDTGELPGEVLSYLNASRYCESDRLGEFAAKQFAGLAPGYTQVTAICNWIYDYLDYVAGTTDALTSAADVLIQRNGVCRDYAHLAITLCRSLGTPARYVSGYAVGLFPPDFHGFFEAFIGERWYLFDATRMVSADGLVRIGTGRDATEASFATIMGNAALESISVSAKAVSQQASSSVDIDKMGVSTV